MSAQGHRAAVANEGVGSNGAAERARGPGAGLPAVARRVATVDAKLVRFVEERPLTAVCAAVAVGYLIGRVFTRLV